MIDPSPGPTLDIVEAEADMHVRKSSPLKDNNNAEMKKVNMYRKKKLITDSYVVSLILLPLNRLAIIECGLSIFLRCKFIYLNNI